MKPLFVSYKRYQEMEDMLNRSMQNTEDAIALAIDYKKKYFSLIEILSNTSKEIIKTFGDDKGEA